MSVDRRARLVHHWGGGLSYILPVLAFLSAPMPSTLPFHAKYTHSPYMRVPAVPHSRLRVLQPRRSPANFRPPFIPTRAFFSLSANPPTRPPAHEVPSRETQGFRGMFTCLSRPAASPALRPYVPSPHFRPPSTLSPCAPHPRSSRCSPRSTGRSIAAGWPHPAPRSCASST